MRLDPPPWPPRSDASRAVALEVLIHGPLSRSELAVRLDLSQGSLTRLSTPLVDSGLLVESESRPMGRAGRRSRPLDIASDSRHFIGVKLTGDHVYAVATDMRAEVAAFDSRPLASREPGAVAAVIAELAGAVAENVPAVTALGVGLGGLVDADQSHVRSATFLGWSDVDFAPMLAERLGIPAVIENDIVALTELEHWFGLGRGLDRFSVITLGAGIGYGAVVNGRMVLDLDSGIGLVGHWPMESFGPLCHAGHTGCAAAMLAAPGVVKSISSALDRPVSYEECLELAATGNPAARRIVDDAGRGLGRLIAAVANLMAPQRIILGGEGVRLADVAAGAVSEGVQRDRDPRARPLDIRINRSDETQWCRGAAVVAIQTFVLGAHAGDLPIGNGDGDGARDRHPGGDGRSVLSRALPNKT
jgi:predicted NBD/HSP70 family sugar kinase